MPSDWTPTSPTPKRLEHRAHRAAGDDAGTGRSRTHQHLAGAVMAAHFVMQRAAVLQRHADQGALGGFGRLADGFGHFARLAVAETDPAVLVADHDQRGEAEAATALHDLGDTIDVHQLVDEFVVALFAIAAAAAFVVPLLSVTRHYSFLAF